MFTVVKFDRSIMEWIQRHLKTRRMDKLMLWATRMGDGGAVWLLLSVLLVCREKTRHAGFALLLCVTVCAAIGNLAIKPIFRRTRPCNLNFSRPLLLKRPEDSSFPSCHTLTSFAAAVTVCQTGGFLGAASFFFASLISFSRMYLYVHYPSDVLIGALIGVAAGGFFLS
ncbi:MAG: phosphatase PAP2 family protein [Synergistaceae bacterium]|nr:phosphatase PAP2 family protein [Synergistaceae bacterium]